jgi:hypothetical protein
MHRIIMIIGSCKAQAIKTIACLIYLPPVQVQGVFVVPHISSGDY